MATTAPRLNRLAPVSSRVKIAVKPLYNQAFCPPSRIAPPTGPKALSYHEIRESDRDCIALASPSTSKKQRLSEDHVARALSPEIAPEQLDTDDESGSSHFVCLYRKIQNSIQKKAITWEGDGVLVLFPSPSGTMAVLKDSTQGKTLGSVMLGIHIDVRSGKLIKVGCRQLEIQRPATVAEIQALGSSAHDGHGESGWSDIVKIDGVSLIFCTLIRLHAQGWSKAYCLLF